MRKGKLTDVVYERSVMRALRGSWKKGENSSSVLRAPLQQQVAAAHERCGFYGVHAVMNRAAAQGREVEALLLSLFLPEETPEERLREILAEALAAAKQRSVRIADAAVTVTDSAAHPLLTVTALEKENTARGCAGKKAAPGMDVVMTKWAGIEGTAVLAVREREALLTRYSAQLVEEMADFDQYLSAAAAARIAGESSACGLCAVGEGGVFAALWELAQKANAGVEIVLKKIPIRQETVELCNFLDLNPYELAGNGSMLAITESGEALVRALEAAGIPAAVIGAVTDNRDRVIVNGEERRFLEPGKADEIFRIMEKREEKTC